MIRLSKERTARTVHNMWEFKLTGTPTCCTGSAPKEPFDNPIRKYGKIRKIPVDEYPSLCYSYLMSASTGSIRVHFTIRACTGFDGGFEVAEAIRGPGPR